jgi:hypothetical protein
MKSERVEDRLPSPRRGFVHERAAKEFDANFIITESDVDMGRLEGEFPGVNDERKGALLRDCGHFAPEKSNINVTTPEAAGIPLHG